ncbi:TlpA disulfide reductase family protein [Natronoflexus pectinivorans]|uniref:Uncharacterized protein DUF4369 n=1 Tax=Natronoflexus pectinivorans TaxID=682526 RepID=A0A4R2GNL4_9BACT|nr:TlpA disulfide reductase family protein [Natronoflexus pectinivorans]TCO10873.1 uncharacterized protein DUF4369 [Natronoflexus pectinivorans]
MRKLSIFLLILVVLGSCARQDRFIIEGSVTEGAGETLYLYRMDLAGDVLIDSTVIGRNDQFTFRQNALFEPTFFKLSLTPGRFITLLGDSTEHININASLNRFSRDYKVENSPGSEKVQMLKRRITDLRSEVDVIIENFNNLSEPQQAEQLEAVSIRLTEEIDEYKKFIGAFVMENPRSFTSYYALFLTFSDETLVMNVLDRDDQRLFATIATSLNLAYPDSERVRHLYNMVLSVKAEERMAQMIQELAEEGRSYPELVLPDLDGNDVALSSLEGNVILVSFWGSWDETSVRENRNLKRLYSQYHHRGFEIYQVGLERSRVLWESAVVRDELPWISVSDLQFTNSYAAQVFNVQRIPANYLISRDGELVGKDLFGTRLEERLREEL